MIGDPHTGPLWIHPLHSFPGPDAGSAVCGFYFEIISNHADFSSVTISRRLRLNFVEKSAISYVGICVVVEVKVANKMSNPVYLMSMLVCFLSGTFPDMQIKSITHTRKIYSE